ncbi:MAG: hypothetical protein J5750_02125 [Clostridiales bacterium]|nr:hypothetical protein [Clostridiales bacterium]
MLDAVTLLTFGAMGILLCFYGFRMFRFSMALAGFFMGMQLGGILNSVFLLEKIPESTQEMWDFLFPIGLGLLLAIISYAIYQKALFFISMFFTWYTLMKISLLYIIKTQNNLQLFISLSTDSVAKLTDGSDGAQTLISDEQMSKVMSWIPGSTDGEKLLAICLIALVIGILVGIIICLIQAPAIKIVTAVIGADLLRDVFLGAMGMLYSWDSLPSFLLPVVKQGLFNGWVSFFIWAALIGSGITVQIKAGDD